MSHKNVVKLINDVERFLKFLKFLLYEIFFLISHKKSKTKKNAMRINSNLENC